MEATKHAAGPDVDADAGADAAKDTTSLEKQSIQESSIHRTR